MSNDGPNERSAAERMPTEVAARRAAQECVANLRRWAEANGMTFEKCCAQIRAQLDERIATRKRGETPPEIGP